MSVWYCLYSLVFSGILWYSLVFSGMSGIPIILSGIVYMEHKYLVTRRAVARLSAVGGQRGAIENIF